MLVPDEILGRIMDVLDSCDAKLDRLARIASVEEGEEAIATATSWQ
jgi:hypothetical protein